MTVIPRQPRSAVPTDTGLDDLLSITSEGAEFVAPVESSRRWIVVSLGAAFALSAVAYTGFRAFDLQPSYALLFAVSLGVVLVRRAARAAREPAWCRVGDLVRPPVGRATWSDGGHRDGMVTAILRWDRRLDWGNGYTERFSATLLPRLWELANERLRQRHGITLASDPEGARALLGPDIWSLLVGESPTTPSPAQVTALVARLAEI